ncbi:MAG: hypothetical protein ACHQ6U_09955 [Thermodesulfobacteriota bacterium]
MSKHEAKKQENGHQKLFELTKDEKAGALYIMGVVILIFSIIFLASLTHVFLQAP